MLQATAPPQDQAERRDLAGILLSAIRALPDGRQQSVLVWGYLAELDDGEIAERLGVTRNHVHQLRHRALSSLRGDRALLERLRDYLAEG